MFSFGLFAMLNIEKFKHLAKKKIEELTNDKPHLTLREMQETLNDYINKLGHKTENFIEEDGFIVIKIHEYS